VSQTDNVFTLTPSTDEANAGSFVITFTASDGINLGTANSTFTLGFLSPQWKDAVLSIGTNSTNGLDNSTFIDRSTNAHTVTPTGSPVQTAFHPYLENWSVEFDGTDDFIIFADNTDWDFVNSGDFTVDFWMNSRVSSNITVLGQSGGGGSRPDKWGLYINDTSVGLSAGTIGWHLGSNGNIQGPSFTPDINTWYHIQCSRESDTWYFFVDGTLLGTASSTARPSVVANTLRIGSDGESYRDFNGHLSNVRIVKGTNLNTTSFTPITENLTAVTNTVLLICQSNRFVDNSSNSYTATFSGTPKISAFNPFGQESEYAVGENKGSIYLPGGSDYVEVTNGLSIGSGDFTLECWINVPQSSDDAIFEFRDANLSSSGFTVTVLDNDTIRIFSDVARITVDNIAFLHQWTHVCVERVNNTTTLYINGVAGASTTTLASNLSDNTFLIGESSQYGGFTGYISDVRLVKGTAIYTTDFTPPTAPVGPSSETNYTVTVASTDTGNKYFVDGVQQPLLALVEGNTYIFDQSDSSNSTHPLRFSTTDDGTHGGGTEYTTGVVTVGTAGNAGAYTQITVAEGAPTLYYYCVNHSGMGGQANTPNASLYLPMDNAGIFDKTGNNTLTLVGDTATSTTQTKFADTAMYFDGSGDYIEIDNEPLFNFGTQNFTIETWYKHQGTTGNYPSIISGQAWNSLAGGVGFRFDNLGSSRVQFFWNGVGDPWLSSSSTFNNTSSSPWMHLALTREGNTFRIFVNGVLEATGTNSGNINFSHGGNTFIGFGPWDGGNGYLNAYLENLQVHRGLAKYTTNFTPPNRTQGRVNQTTS